MTLNGVMAVVLQLCVISPNSITSGAHCVKVVEDVVVKMFTFAISVSSSDCLPCSHIGVFPDSVVIIRVLSLPLYVLFTMCTDTKTVTEASEC